MSSYSFNQIVGNRLKLLKPATVYIRFPKSPYTESWKSGYLTPPIDTYVHQNGNLYWQFGEGSYSKFIKHEQGLFKLVPAAGGSLGPAGGYGTTTDGSSVASSTNAKSSWLSNIFGTTAGLGSEVQTIMEYVVVVLAGIIGIKIFNLLK